MRGRKRAGTFLLISISITSLTTESIAAGRTVTAPVNTILNGKGAPKSSLGIDGDFYIDTRSLLIYGPKSKGRWPTPASIQGPTGPAGNDGKNGSDGKVNSNVSAITGAQGAVGPQGEKGERGEKGDQGPSGTSGAAGVQGAQGLPGVSGPSGPQGLQGVAGPQGAQGIQGVAGAAGVDGAAGPPGAKGETGTSGSSEIQIVDIPTWLLSSRTHFSSTSSLEFGNFVAGHVYKIEIFIYGVSSFPEIILGIALNFQGGNFQYDYIYNRSSYAKSGDTQDKYVVFIAGTVTAVSGSHGLSVEVIDALGDSGNAPLTLTGKAYITSVGAIK